MGMVKSLQKSTKRSMGALKGVHSDKGSANLITMVPRCVHSRVVVVGTRD